MLAVDKRHDLINVFNNYNFDLCHYFSYGVLQT